MTRSRAALRLMLSSAALVALVGALLLGAAPARAQSITQSNLEGRLDKIRQGQRNARIAVDVLVAKHLLTPPDFPSFPDDKWSNAKGKKFDPPANGLGNGKGGFLPASLGVARTDEFDAPLGYCARGKGGINAKSPIVYGVIWPGLDGIFQTNCADVLQHPGKVRDTGLRESGANGDDYVAFASVNYILGNAVTKVLSVPDDAALGALDTTEVAIGELRFVADTARLWRWNGTIWEDASGLADLDGDGDPDSLKLKSLTLTGKNGPLRAAPNGLVVNFAFLPDATNTLVVTNGDGKTPGVNDVSVGLKEVPLAPAASTAGDYIPLPIIDAYGRVTGFDNTAISLQTSVNKYGWGLGGNTGTSSAGGIGALAGNTNFVGTTDEQDLRLVTNGKVGIILDKNGVTTTGNLNTASLGVTGSLTVNGVVYSTDEARIGNALQIVRTDQELTTPLFRVQNMVGGAITDQVVFDTDGSVTLKALGGGSAPFAPPVGNDAYDRVVLANADGELSQASTESLFAKSAWLLKGNVGVFDKDGNPVDFFGTVNDYPLVIRTNDKERMRILGGTGADAGFVGIGTATPTALLDVAGSLRARGNASVDGALTVADVLNANGGVVTPSVSNAGTLQLSATGASGTLVARTAGEDRLLITPAGDVGIGIGAPTARLDVNGSFRVRDASILDGALTVNGATDLKGKLAVANAATFADAATVKGLLTATAGINANTIAVTGNGSFGTLGVTGATTLTSLGGTSPNTSLTGLDRVVMTGSDGVLSQVATSALFSANAWVRGGNVGTDPEKEFVGTLDAAPLVIRTNDMERMRILGGTGADAGYVGIGTATPTALLDVNGSFRAAGNSVLGGSLDVTGATRFRDAVRVDGATDLKGTLAVANAAQFNGTVGVVGLLTAAGGLDTVNGSADIGGDLRVDGTTTLTKLLTANGGIGTNTLSATTSVTTPLLTSAGALEMRAAAGDLALRSSGAIVASTGPTFAERMRITADGRVGLNTGATFFDSALFIKTGANDRQGLRIEANSAAQTGDLLQITYLVGTTPFEALQVSGSGFLRVNRAATFNNTVGVAGLLTAFTGVQTPSVSSDNASGLSLTAAGGTLRLAANGNNVITARTNDTERLRIASDGKVGIGNFSGAVLSAVLDVDGDLRVRTASTLDGALTVGGSATLNGVTQVNNTLGVLNLLTATGGVRTSTVSSANASNLSLTATGGTLGLAATGSNIITASTNGAERLRITSGGLVGINTGATVGAALQVNSGADGNVGFIVRGNSATQAVDLLQVQRGNGANALTVNQRGDLSLLPYGSAAGNAAELRFVVPTGAQNNYVGFRAPNATTGGVNIVWTLPEGDGATNGMVLATNGQGALRWIDPLTSSSGWTLTGNIGTKSGGALGFAPDANSNFIGTLETATPVDFRFVTGGLVRAIITGGGQFQTNDVAIGGGTVNGVTINNSTIGLTSAAAARFTTVETPEITSTGNDLNLRVTGGLNENRSIIASTNGVERLRVRGSLGGSDPYAGFVGINQSNPTYRLDVGGTFRATGASVIGGTLDVTGATTVGGATTVNNTLRATGATTLESTLNVTGATTISGATQINNTLGVQQLLTATGGVRTPTVNGTTTLGLTADAGNLSLAAGGANAITASTAGVERLVITSDGNVGIGMGNIAPANRLDVGGSFRASGPANFTSSLTVAVGQFTSLGGTLGVTGNTTLSSLGGATANTNLSGLDRVVMTGSSGLLSQVSTETLVGATAWAITGNAGTSSGGALGSAPIGNYIGTRETATPVDLRFATGGLVRAILTGAGQFQTNNVAIGGGTINNTVIGGTTAAAGTFTTVTTPIVTSAGNLALSATGTNVITASTSGAERLRITSGGLVGINTGATVGAALQVNTGGNNTVGLIVRGNGTSQSANLLAVQSWNGTASSDVLTVANSGATTIAGATQINNTLGVQNLLTASGGVRTPTVNGTTTLGLTADAGTLSLTAGGANAITASTNGAERLRINSLGEIGIGTDAPTARLDVNGTLRVRDAAALNSTLTVSGVSTLNGATTVNNTLRATGATTLESTLGVAGATTIGGATQINNTLGVQSLLTASGGVRTSTVSSASGALSLTATSGTLALAAGGPNAITFRTDGA